MAFSSSQFPVFFLAFFWVYWLLPKRGRGLWLIVAGCYFYASVALSYLWILAALIVCDFAIGQLIEATRNPKSRLGFLIFGLVANFTALILFKWLSESQSTSIPPGLSFHTFQSAAYLIEVYFHRFQAERHFTTYAQYILFWPQLVAGPIERPNGLLRQIQTSRNPSQTLTIEGFELLVLGFIKKLVIADRISLLTGPVFTNPHFYAGVPLLVAVLAFGFEIYCDFSGYTDIARGCGKLMGYELVENFRQPLLSSSPAELWRKWHMSLTSWLRDYLYLPMVGKDPSRSKKMAGVVCVFAIIGLWHGLRPTMLLWGLYESLWVIAAHRFKFQRLGVLSVPVTFAIVAIGFGFFKSHTLGDARYFYSHLFSTMRSPAENGLLGFPPDIFLASLVVIGLCIAMDSYQKWAPNTWTKLPGPLRWTALQIGVLLVLFAGKFEERVFIYFQF